MQALGSLEEALVVAGSDGAIEHWLGGAAALLGFSARVATGKPLTWLLRSQRDASVFDLRELAQAGRRDTSVWLRKREGHLRAALTMTRLPGGGAAVLARRLEPWMRPGGSGGVDWELLLGAAFRDLLQSAGPRMEALDTVAELAPLVVRHARRLLPDFDCGLLVVPSRRPRNFEVSAGAGPWAESQVGRELPQSGTAAGRALRSRRTLETVRLQEESSIRGTLAGAGIRSACLIPLVSRRALPDGRRGLGVLGFYRTERRFGTPYERRVMDELAGLVSLILQRAELSRSLVDTADRLRVGVDLALDLAASLDPHDVVRRLLERTLAAADADHAVMLRVHGEEVVVDQGLDPVQPVAPAGARFSAGGAVSGGRAVVRQAIRTQRPAIATGYRVRGLPAPHRATLAGLRHTAALPLVLGGATIAVLVVGRRRPQPFIGADLAVLQLICNVAVLALGNAWLFTEAEEASRVKTEFLNLAAHELRTPLTVIRGYLALLQEGSLGPAAEAWTRPLTVLAAKTEELAGLVDGLMTAARLETASLRARREVLDVAELLLDARRRAELRASELGAKVVVEAQPGLRVMADRDHLVRILDNLLANGLIYGRDRPWVRLRSRPGTRDRVRIEIEDRGRGIAPEDRDRVFERFYRAPHGDYPAVPGTGLGLYICAELAAVNGGRVDLRWTRPGRGSRFVLDLPQGAGGG